MSETYSTTLAQYLTFTLGEETYAFDVGNVREVLEVIPITKIPRMPHFVSGVINVRGSVVPVIDLRLKLGMSLADKTVNSCIIVIEVSIEGVNTVLGVLVDSVQEVVEFDASKIEPPPKIGTGIRSDFLQGIGKRDERFVMIMNLSRVLSVEEAMMLQAAEGEPVTASASK
jgi:purine-binding chemotaxis protein CheW